MRQRDLFNDQPQADLFDTEPPAPYRADPAKVRAELRRILDQAKGAASLPWSPEKLRYHQLVFPQMSRWLPDEEAAQLRFEFETELKRLHAA